MRRLATKALVLVAAATVGGCGSSTTAGGIPSDRLEAEALRISGELFSPCLNYDGPWNDAALVRSSTETDGVVTVDVFLTEIATGADTTYSFRVNTGLGSYTGIPNPGAGFPVNDAATFAVDNCPA